MSNKSKTFYGRYVYEGYKLTYNANGGKFADSTEGTKVINNMQENDTVTVMTAPTREGYTFTGWTNESVTYKSGDTFSMPASDYTLTAQWEQNVTLNFHNSSSGTSIASKTGERGSTFTAGSNIQIDLEAAKVFAKDVKYGLKAEDVDAAKTLDDLTKLGFTFEFDGWTTEAHNGGNEFVKGTPMSTLGVTYSNSAYQNVAIFDGLTADVYAHYDISYSPVKKEITITANSNSKPYDGTALTDGGYTFTQNVLAEGDKLTAVVEGSATNVDDTAVDNNKVTSYKIMRGKTDVTDTYYNVTVVCGTLTVTPNTTDLGLTAESNGGEYNGSAYREFDSSD